MSDQDFVIVDEEKDSEIPQEKENRTEDSRKEVVKDAEKEREDDDGYEKICFICHRPVSSVTDNGIWAWLSRRDSPLPPSRHNRTSATSSARVKTTRNVSSIR